MILWWGLKPTSNIGKPRASGDDPRTARKAVVSTKLGKPRASGDDPVVTSTRRYGDV